MRGKRVNGWSVMELKGKGVIVLNVADITPG